MSTLDRHNLRRFRRYSGRLNRMIEDGSFGSLDARKRHRLLRRLRTLHDGLAGIVSEVTLRSILAAAAVVVLGIAGCASGSGNDADTGTDTGGDVAADTDVTDVPDMDTEAPPDTAADPDVVEDADAIEDADLDAGEDAGPLTPSFAAPSENPFGLTSMTTVVGLPELADLDGDGDEDLLAGIVDYTGTSLLYFQNTGTANSPAFAAPLTNPLGITPGGYIAAPAVADMDGDGDLDVFLGEADYSSLSLEYYENTGTPTSPAFASPVSNPFGITGLAGDVPFPELDDIDGDGDLDLFVGDFTGEIRYYQNTGTSTSPAFATPIPTPFGFTPTYNIAAPAITDIDGDGDDDLFVGESLGTIQFFENTGTAFSATFTTPVPSPFGLTAVDRYAAPDFSDIDADGDMDLFVGEYDGDIQYFENTTL